MAEKKFGNETYRCEKLDAEGAMRLLIRTTKMFGPAGAVMTALGEKDKTKAEAQQFAALAEFIGKVDEDEAVAYVKELIGLCRCGGDQAIFGVHVQDLGEAFQVCMWVLEVQFRDFLGGKPGTTIRKALAA